jgi:hypothetical protein
MALRKGKLIKSKGSYYFVADDLGMAYNLQMVHVQDFAGVDVMNQRIDLINGAIGNLPNKQDGWKATIGVHKTTWDALPEKWKVIFQAKVHILLYDSTANLQAGDPVEAFPSIPTYRQVDLVWVSDDEVWTRYDQDGFGYHYQNIKPVPTPDAAIPPSDTTPSTPPVVVPTLSSFNLRLECLKLATDIALYNSSIAENPITLETINIQSIADALLEYTKIE